MSLMDDCRKLFVEKILPIYSKYRASTRPSSDYVVNMKIYGFELVRLIICLEKFSLKVWGEEKWWVWEIVNCFLNVMIVVLLAFLIGFFSVEDDNFLT